MDKLASRVNWVVHQHPYRRAAVHFQICISLLICACARARGPAMAHWHVTSSVSLACSSARLAGLKSADKSAKTVFIVREKYCRFKLINRLISSNEQATLDN